MDRVASILGILNFGNTFFPEQQGIEDPNPKCGVRVAVGLNVDSLASALGGSFQDIRLFNNKAEAIARN